MAAKVIIIK